MYYISKTVMKTLLELIVVVCGFVIKVIPGLVGDFVIDKGWGGGAAVMSQGDMYV